MMPVEHHKTPTEPGAGWTTGFLRQTLLASGEPCDIKKWADSLVEVLREHKPDNEIHIFGINRIPKMPNFFLASSSEKYVREHPLLINVTQKTADVFLAPVTQGIRILEEEMPMTVFYNVDDPPKRVELPFYDAICFDTELHSIVIGLIVTEDSVNEFLTQEELAELLPLVRSHAMPLLEVHTLRHVKAQQDDDIQSLLDMVRQSHPDFATVRVASRDEEEFVQPLTEEKSYGAHFLQHLTVELRTPLSQILQSIGKVLELSAGGQGSGRMHELAVSVQFQAMIQEELLRCLGNIAALSHGDVKPRQGAFPMQAFIRKVHSSAAEVGRRYDAKVELEEYTRNIFIAGDDETLARMVERLVALTLTHCRGGTLWVRTSDDPARVPKGMVGLEIEDSGKVPRDEPLSTLLEPKNLASLNHPRLRRGGGLLLKLLELYMEKSGGGFRLRFGDHDGFCVQLQLPQVRRTEAERIKNESQW